MLPALLSNFPSIPLQISKKVVVMLAAASLVLGLVSVYLWLYLPVQTHAFSYSNDNCINELTLLPEWQQQSPSSFDIAYREAISVGGVSVASQKTCLTPNRPLASDSEQVRTSMWIDWFARQSYVVEIPNPPQISIEPLEKPIPLTKPVMLPMSEGDTVHAYHLGVDERQSVCSSEDEILNCPLDELGLSQGESYEFAVSRSFDGQVVEQVAEQETEILRAAKVVKSSIKADQVVYDKPREVEIEFDKVIANAKVELEQQGDDEIDIQVSTEVNNKLLTVAWGEDLNRQKQFELVIDEVEAEDGSVLVDPYRLKFSTSGGPRVASVSIPTHGVAPNATVVISFDQELKTNQDVNSLVSIKGGGGSISQQGNTFVVALSGLGRCVDFGIQVKNGVTSKYGISGDSAWNFQSRTACRTVETIGYSVQGRPIQAYFYGNGSTSMLYTGAIHGNEISSSYLMEHWMDELEANYRSIPTGRQIVVVPEVNPDGIANGTRNNANNVDLNRNWAVSDWQADITDTWGDPIKNGGGKSAMSEPETKALASLVSRLRPRLTMSFHSVGGVVLANQAADSSSLASTYASMTPYYNGTGQSSQVFDYQITGTFDDWIAEKFGLASVLVELSSHTYSQYPANKSALWEMARR